MRPHSLLEELVADLRLIVVFMAPADTTAPDPILEPRVYVRARTGSWELIDFGRSRRALELACLLAGDPGGMRATDVETAMSGGGSKLRGAANNAKQALRKVLKSVDAADLLDVPSSKGRGAGAWRLRGAETDVALARQAIGRSDWESAAALVHHGEPRLTGFQQISGKPGGWADVGPLYPGAPPQRSPPMLPVDLIASAARSAEHVRLARASWSPEAPRGVFPADTPSGREPRIDRPRGSGSSARARVRWIAAAGVAALALALALAGVVLWGGRPTAGGVRGGRYEQESPAHALETFRSPSLLAATDRGPSVAPGERVRVACRVYSASIRSAAPYFWYRLLGPPWAGRYFATANAFLNGDPASDYAGPHPDPPEHPHNVDMTVAPCSGPAGSLKRARGPAPTLSAPNARQATGPMIAAKARLVVSCAAVGGSGSRPKVVYRIATRPFDDRYYADSSVFDPGQEGGDPNVAPC